MKLNHMLELDGMTAGWLAEIDGGIVKVESLDGSKIGPYVPQTAISRVSILPLTMAFGAGMSWSLYQWIADTLLFKSLRRKGAVVHLDSSKRIKLQQEFTDALITEISFPALEKSAKDPAMLLLKIKPEYTENTTAGAGDPASLGVFAAGSFKPWRVGDFRLFIDGIDTLHVTRIESIAFGSRVEEMYVGANRYPELEPIGIKLPNLVVTLPERHAADFVTWHKDLVGRGSLTKERHGSLEYRAPDSSTTYFSLEFANMEIVALTKTEHGVQIEMEYRKINFRCESAACR